MRLRATRAQIATKEKALTTVDLFAHLILGSARCPKFEAATWESRALATTSR